MANSIPTTRFRFWLWLIALIGVIVPRRLRADWKQEWEAELRYREVLLADWDKLNWKTKLDLLRRSLGAFWDALVLQPRRLEDEMFQDLRFGLRMLLKNPGFTLIAVFTLALGIGANTAIFSVVNGILLRPLPYAEPERLVMVWETAPKLGLERDLASTGNFIDWRQHTQVFTQIAALSLWNGNLTSGDEPERVGCAYVTADFFQLLGIKPVRGRAFLPLEEKEGGLVIVSHGLWQRRFGADPSLVGKTLLVNHRNFTVIGIAPPGFQFPDKQTELWMNSMLNSAMNSDGTFGRDYHSEKVIARLKPQVTLAQAQGEMDILARSLEQQYPSTNAGRGVKLVPLLEQEVGDIRPALRLLLGVVGLVLLIACVNVANLLLSRAAVRQKEMAIRAALGARRWRVMRQLLTESLLLALASGGCGLLLARWSIAVLLAASPSAIPRVQEITLDGRVLGFTLIISLLTGVVFGLVPAFAASKPDLTAALKESGLKSAGSQSRNRVRHLLVIAEMALTLVLLVGAGLMIKSFLRLRSVDPGFDPQRVLTMQMTLPMREYSPWTAGPNFWQPLLERLEKLPGVQAVSAASRLPVDGEQEITRLVVEGHQRQLGVASPTANVQSVSPGYFRMMGIPLRTGREFTEQDRDYAGAPSVVIINEEMARRLWPNENPLGKKLKLGTNPQSSAPWRLVVGVAGNVRHAGLDAELKPEMYLPVIQTLQYAALLVRTAADPLSMVSAVRGQAQAIDREVPIFNLRTVDQILAESLARRQFNMRLLAIFAAVALLLAAVGIYGVMSYAVTQRTHEIGIRMALGAESRDVLWLVVSQGMTLTLIGVAAGLVAALALTRVMKNLLFGVSTTDPATFAGIALLLIGVAFIASYLPARRATKVDPLVALRHE